MRLDVVQGIQEVVVDTVSGQHSCLYVSPRTRRAASRNGMAALLVLGQILEHRAGIEPANTGFADQRVSHFATGARNEKSHLAGGSRSSSILLVGFLAYRDARAVLL